MPDAATLSLGQTAIAFVLAVPAAAALAVFLLIIVVALGLAVTGAAGWALTRASAAVLGKPGDIWR